MKRFLLAVIYTILSLNFMSCGSSDTIDSKDVNEDRMQRDFHVVYKQLTKELHVYAQFRVGGSTGTTVRLTDGTSIAINETKLFEHDGSKVVIPIKGTFYDTMITDASPEREYKFRWTRHDGKIFETLIDLTVGPLETDLQPNQVISRSKPLPVVVTSPALTPSEYINIVIQGPDLNYETKTTTSHDIKSLKYIFQPADLSGFQGATSTFVKRVSKRSTSNGDDDIGGTITTERWSSPVTVEFVQ